MAKIYKYTAYVELTILERSILLSAVSGIYRVYSVSLQSKHSKAVRDRANISETVRDIDIVSIERK